MVSACTSAPRRTSSTHEWNTDETGPTRNQDTTHRPPPACCGPGVCTPATLSGKFVDLQTRLAWPACKIDASAPFPS